MKTFNITTLGCKVNQHDGRLIRENLLSAGRKDTGSPRRAPGHMHRQYLRCDRGE